MTDAPIDQVLAALGGGRQSGGSWMAKCPAHPDSTASLSVSRGRNGNVLVHCHAGCEVPDIVRCAGLDMGDLFAEPLERPDAPRIVKTYPYADEIGTVLYEVVRFEPKDFRQRRPKPDGTYTWKLNGVRRVPYRLPELVAGVEQGRRVFIAEGEKDVDALVEAGEVATCCPAGAGKWTNVADIARQVLADAEVIVVADRDKAGRAHARDVVGRLTGAAASIVVVEAATGKDAADHLGAGRSIDELLEVDLAQDLEPTTLGPSPSPADEGSSSSWLPVDLGPAIRGEQTAPEPGILFRSDGLGLFYRGKVHVLAGEPESGKSWLAQLAAAIVLIAGGRVVYVDFEDDALGIVGRLRALGVTADQILAGLVYLRPDEALGDNGHLLDQACAGSELAILDGVTEAMAAHGWAPKNDIDVALFQTRILRRMSASGAAVVVIDHVVKSSSERGRWATGSQHKLAGVDGAQYLIEVIKPWAPGRSGLAAVTVTKDRPGRIRAGLEDTSMKVVGTMVVTAWPDGGVRIEIAVAQAQQEAADGGHRPSILMARVSAFLAAHKDMTDPSTNTVRKGVRGDDSSIDRALVVLQLEGYATSSKVGNGTYWQHVKPFTTDGQERVESA